MGLEFIPAYLMAALLGLILVAPFLPGEMPDYPDRRDPDRNRAPQRCHQNRRFLIAKALSSPCGWCI